MVKAKPLEDSELEQILKVGDGYLATPQEDKSSTRRLVAELVAALRQTMKDVKYLSQDHGRMKCDKCYEWMHDDECCSTAGGFVCLNCGEDDDD